MIFIWFLHGMAHFKELAIPNTSIKNHVNWIKNTTTIWTRERPACRGSKRDRLSLTLSRLLNCLWPQFSIQNAIFENVGQSKENQVLGRSPQSWPTACWVLKGTGPTSTLSTPWGAWPGRPGSPSSASARLSSSMGPGPSTGTQNFFSWTAWRLPGKKNIRETFELWRKITNNPLTNEEYFSTDQVSTSQTDR